MLFTCIREGLLSGSANGRKGSIAPIRFLKQRPFDQRFARLGSPNFERLLCRVFHCGCDDEQRLLCFETGHSRREFFEASMAEGGRFLPKALPVSRRSRERSLSGT